MKPILLKARSHMYRHWRKRRSGNVWAMLSELALAKPRFFRFNDHTFQRHQSAAAPGYAGRPVLRCARQALSDGQSRPPSRKKSILVDELVKARSAVRSAKLACDQVEEAAAHCAVDTVKRELGERGAVWWTDGAPDFNRHKVTDTPYARWFSGSRAARRREEGP
jgi:hypothetical protein